MSHNICCQNKRFRLVLNYREHNPPKLARSKRAMFVKGENNVPFHHGWSNSSRLEGEVLQATRCHSKGGSWCQSPLSRKRCAIDGVGDDGRARAHNTAVPRGPRPRSWGQREILCLRGRRFDAGLGVQPRRGHTPQTRSHKPRGGGSCRIRTWSVESFGNRASRGVCHNRTEGQHQHRVGNVSRLSHLSRSAWDQVTDSVRWYKTAQGLSLRRFSTYKHNPCIFKRNVLDFCHAYKNKES